MRFLADAVLVCWMPDQSTENEDQYLKIRIRLSLIITEGLWIKCSHDNHILILVKLGSNKN